MSDEWPIGTCVRLVHHTRPGMVDGPVYESEVEPGQPRQMVRWEPIPIDPYERVTGWHPKVLVPFDRPPEDDPPFVISGGMIFAKSGFIDDSGYPFIGKVQVVS